MVFALNNAEAAEEVLLRGHTRFRRVEQVVDLLTESLKDGKSSPATKVARLFVVSDILHNSSATVRNASRYRANLEEKLPSAFEHLQVVLNGLQNQRDVYEVM